MKVSTGLNSSKVLINSTKPITQEDLIWLQNAPFYRENIITSLQNRLNELRK